MSHAIRLHEHTTHISSGMSPEELWTRYNSSHSYLQNSHPWELPAYVLGTILRYGNKFPKYIQRYSRAQYFGSSPLHTSTLGLVRALNTVNISPQFSLVFGDYLRLFMKEMIKNLQFVQIWSPFIISRVHMMMRNMNLTFLMSVWRQNIWKLEGISNTRGTPRSQVRRKTFLMIQERNNLDIY